MDGRAAAGRWAGYERREWTDEETDDLARRFRASRFAAGVDDPGDMLSSLLWFGTGYGPGDPLHWSPTAVEILLLDWIPRKIMADVEVLADAPDVLRAFIRFCHHERGIRPGLTDETIAAVDMFEPEYQELIRSDRLQGPEALLAAMGLHDGEDTDPAVEVAEIMLDTLREAVGGEKALDALDAEPLPDEPFAWDAVPPDVHGRVGQVLDLVERCCAELLDAEYRTACRRLLADVAAGDPEIFRRRGKAEMTAAAVCWIVGKANALFDPTAPGLTMQVKQLMAHFGVTSASQRSGIAAARDRGRAGQPVRGHEPGDAALPDRRAPGADPGRPGAVPGDGGLTDARSGWVRRACVIDGLGTRDPYTSLMSPYRRSRYDHERDLGRAGPGPRRSTPDARHGRNPAGRAPPVTSRDVQCAVLSRPDRSRERSRTAAASRRGRAGHPGVAAGAGAAVRSAHA